MRVRLELRRRIESGCEREGPYASGQGGCLDNLVGRWCCVCEGGILEFAAVRVTIASGGHLKMGSSNLVQPKRMRRVKVVMKVELDVCAMPCLPKGEAHRVMRLRCAALQGVAKGRI